MESPVHVLMLSIQAVRGLPRLRAPGIVPCIIFLNATPFCDAQLDSDASKESSIRWSADPRTLRGTL